MVDGSLCGCLGGRVDQVSGGGRAAGGEERRAGGAALCPRREGRRPAEVVEEVVVVVVVVVVRTNHPTQTAIYLLYRIMSAVGGSDHFT